MFNVRRAIRIVQTFAITSAVISAPLLIAASNATVASATSVGVPPCQGSNLVGAFVVNQVGMGHVVTTIAITNVGRRACTLGGYPTLIGLRGSTKHTLRVTGHGTYGGNLHPTKLSPRMSGALLVGTGDMCGPTYGVIPPNQMYVGMIVVLPGNEGTVQVLGAQFDTTCGVYVSQLGWRSQFWIQGV
jgi:Domain of unknown function (DUF4232)